MNEPDSTIIAGTKKCGDWQAFRASLLPGDDKAPWGVAFDDYFHARLRYRYLDPINVLRNHDTWQGEGFSIVAIHCSLIEFLESTVQGKTYRYVQRDSDLGPYEYRRSGEIFEAFLSTREPFKHVFDLPLARDFYENVRCPVLHEARTKGGWRIWAEGPAGLIIDRNQRKLYRNNFHDALLAFIQWYRGKVVSDRTTQEAFLRKINSLCD